MVQVFISYSRQDWLIAEGLAANLNAMGYKVWIDTGIKPNVPYAEEITKALDASQAAIVIWTNDSLSSQWVVWEATQALHANKLIQLRIPDLPIERVPPPFDKFTVYHEGGPGEVAKKIEEVIGAPPQEIEADGLVVQRAPVAPPSSDPRFNPGTTESEQFAARGIFMYSASFLGIGAVTPFLLTGKMATYFASAIFATGLMLLIAMLLYSVYFSVSRFSDRFGRKLVFETIMFGLVASLFAGIVGGYPYAAAMSTDLQSGVSHSDLFITKYVRVIVITAFTGTMLSYLLLALIRYFQLRQRNLGPAWSRRSAIVQITVPIVLVVALTLGVGLLAVNLAHVGTILSNLTNGRINWLGAGQCPSIEVCSRDAGSFCRNCSVGNMSRIDIALILSIFLWSQHVFHMRKFGTNILRILTSSLPIVLAAIFMIIFFHIYPNAFGTTDDIKSWRIIILQSPWILLIFWTIYTVTRAAASIERRSILDHHDER